MTRAEKIMRGTRRIFVVALAVSLLAAPIGDVFARGGRGGDDGGGRRGGDDGGGHRGGDRREFSGGRRHAVGTIVRELPRGRTEIFVGQRPFFFHEGRFFNRHRDGFITVRAPIGAVIATLPIGFATFVVGGVSYYAFDDVYYRRAPEGYVVVDPPVQVLSGTAIVQAYQLNVRSGPGASYGVIKILDRGERLTIRGSVPGWYNVELYDGNMGWVMSQFVALEQPMPEG